MSYVPSGVTLRVSGEQFDRIALLKYRYANGMISAQQFEAHCQNIVPAIKEYPVYHLVVDWEP